MIRLATAFSGIGAVEQALKQLEIDHKIVFACDNGERYLKQTYEELKDGLGGITERAIQKDFVKITPSLYAGEGVPDVPFRLGGQPLLAEIELVDKNETRAKFKRFRTLNSVHPLVLQENIMQLVSNREIICYSLNYLFLVILFLN